MQDIKFRAWDKENKRMLYVEELPQAHHWIDQGVNEIFTDKDYEWLQYTGITVNGKELYEGDILRNKHGKVRLLMHSTDIPQEHKKQSKYWVGVEVFR